MKYAPSIAIAAAAGLAVSVALVVTRDLNSLYGLTALSFAFWAAP